MVIIKEGSHLVVYLRGQAQCVFDNLGGKCNDYYDLSKAKRKDRFLPSTRLFRVQLREKKQKSSELLSTLRQDIRRLTNLAYPTAPSDVKEALSKEQFIDALVSSNMRIRVRQDRSHNLNATVRHAVELQAYVAAYKKEQEAEAYLRNTVSEDIEEDPSQKLPSKLERDITSLQKTVVELSRQLRAKKPQIVVKRI